MPRVEPVTSASLPVRSRSMCGPLEFSTGLFRRRRDKNFPVGRRPRMPAEEPLRGHHHLLGIFGILRHPSLADRQPPIRGIADADEAEPLGFLERSQPEDHSSPGVNGAGWSGYRRSWARRPRGAGNHSPSRAKPHVPRLGQLAGQLRTRAIARRAIGIFRHLTGGDGGRGGERGERDHEPDRGNAE